MKISRLIRGFTLIEMSVVLVIIAIITGMGVSMGLTVLDSSKVTATETKLNVLEDSLFAFRKKFGRLPCPTNSMLLETDANFGVEALNNNGTCYNALLPLQSATYVTPVSLPTYPEAVPSGAVPVKTLGLSNEFMLDGWGRQFMYEVTPAMTRENAFNYSQPGDSCSVTVVNHAGANLPIKPVYALVSYGKNGVGAYLPSGSQVTGTAGTDEITNIRTSTTTPTIRYKNGVSGQLGQSNYYDDIVRFKSRYQLMDAVDLGKVPYYGPDFVMAYNTSSGTQNLMGKRTCGEYKAFTGTMPATAAAIPLYYGFTPNNTNLVMYYGTGICKLYSISGTTITPVTATTPIPNCMTNTSGSGIMAANGDLALHNTSSPYVRSWRLVGSGMSAKYALVPNAFNPGVSNPSTFVMTANAEIMGIARAVALVSSPYNHTYVKKNGYYKRRPPFAGLAALGADYIYPAFSPNSRYYVVAQSVVNDMYLYIWRNVNGEFTPLFSGTTPNYTITSMGGSSTFSFIRFSPDSQFLLVAGGANSPSHDITILHLDPVSETFSLAGFDDTVNGPNDAAFSSDSMFLLVAQKATGATGFSIYRRTGNTFTIDTISPTLTSLYNASAQPWRITTSR